MVEPTEWLVLYPAPNTNKNALTSLRYKMMFLFLELEHESIIAERFWIRIGVGEFFGYVAVHKSTRFEEVTEA